MSKESPYASPTYPVVGERIHSGHFVFLKCGDTPVEEVLRWFGVPDARPVADPHASVSGESTLWVTWRNGWVHLADDWYYSLWHRPDRLDLLLDLSSQQEVFTFGVGECDESYDYAWFREGRLIRMRVVASPNFTDRVVRTDFGDRLPVETAEALCGDGLELGFAIARFIGVDTSHAGLTIRRFACRYPGMRAFYEYLGRF